MKHPSTPQASPEMGPLTVGRKVAALVFGLIAVLALVSSYAIHSGKTAEQATKDTDLAGRQRMLNQRQLLEAMVIAQGGSADIEATRKLLRETPGILSETYADEPKFVESLERQQAVLARVFDKTDAFLASSAAGESAQGAMEEMLASAAEAQKACQATVDLLTEQMYGDMQSSRSMILMALIVCGLASAFASWRIVRGITGTLTDVLQAVEGMSQGHLGHRVPVHTQDEVGAIATAVNATLDNLVAAFGLEELDWNQLAERNEASARLEGMVEQNPVPMMCADRDCNITYMNPAARRILERVEPELPIPVKQIVGSSVDVFHVDPAKQRRILQDPSRLPHRAEIKIGSELVDQEVSALYDARGEYAGPMVTWRLVTKQRAMEERYDDIISNLVTCAEEMRVSARELTAGSEEAASVAQTTLARSQDMTDGNQAVTTATQQMTETVSSIAQSSRDLADSADRAVSAADAANSVVRTLMDANSQISRVTETISNIADQTNLLALNATIEAAGAGEAGRGFAVVAAEVKDLARETMQATGSINDQVRDIHQRSEQVATAIDEINQVIRSVNDLAATLAAAVEEQDITTREISDSIARTAESSTTIANDMSTVANSAESANLTARGVAEAAEQLSELAAQLQAAKAEASAD